MLLAWISLTLSHCSSLSSDYCVRTEQLYISCRPCEGVHRRRSLMSSSSLLQQCPVCLVHLIWMVLTIGGKWPCSCCFAEYCFQNLFNIALSNLVQLPSSFFLCTLDQHPCGAYIQQYWHNRCLEKNCSLFHRIGLTSIWPITYR